MSAIVPYVEQKVYKAEPKQRLFHFAVRKHEMVYFKGGLGSGKTTAGAIQAIMEACYYQPGQTGLIIAPTYKMLYSSTLKELLSWLPHHFIASHNQTKYEIILTNGSTILYRSGDDPETLRGPNCAWLWLDEPRNYALRTVFDNAIARCRPTMKCWLTSTPAGIFHWLYELFIANPLPNSTYIHAKTSDNSHNGEYEKRMRSALSARDAQQELDALDVSFDGLVYDNFTEETNVSLSAEYNPNFGPIFYYIDDGYVLQDGPGHANYHPRVILFAQETPIGGANIFDELIETGVPEYDPTISHALEKTYVDPADGLSKPYPEPMLAYVDSSAAMFKGALTLRGIANVGATHSVLEGIRNVRRMISDANGMVLLHIHPRCKAVIREMHSYRYDKKSQMTGGDRRPLKIDDHTMDSLRYGLFHLRFSNDSQ